MAERVSKVGGRECRNRYVVAGMRTVARMVGVGVGGGVDSRVVWRLRQEVKSLQGKII